MNYKRIIEKLENHEELTQEEELAAQLALVHLPIPYRTRDRVIKHLRKLFKNELKDQSLDSDSCMMGENKVILQSIQKAQQAIKVAQTSMSLGGIERKLEMMEEKGLEDTEEYRKLSEEADRLADLQTKSQEEQKKRDVEREKEQQELKVKEQFEKKKEKVEAAWDKLEQEEWFKKVRKHYPIEQVAADTWRVKSLAADWDEENQPTWDYPTEIDAKEKVLQLINYRYYDYYMREGERGTVSRSPREIEDATDIVLEARQKLNALRRKLLAADEPDKPKKVTEIADAIRRDSDVTDEQAYRMAWETYCSYVNPSYEGCTSKGKSKRKSPKSEY